VCNTNDGGSALALIFAIAVRSVPVTSAFAGLSKPMWLSRARASRDVTVPIGIPTIAAIS
jgi:hypothetical protein